MSDTVGDGLDTLALAAAVHWRPSRRCVQDPSGSFIFLPMETSTLGRLLSPPQDRALERHPASPPKEQKPNLGPDVGSCDHGMGRRRMRPANRPPPPDPAALTRPNCVCVYEKLRGGAGFHLEVRGREEKSR